MKQQLFSCLIQAFLLFCLCSQLAQATICEQLFAYFSRPYLEEISLPKEVEPNANSNPQKGIITLADLDLPNRINVEQKLADQGWTVDYYRGMNELNEWVTVRKKLQELKANPSTTHVEYFAQKVEEHISFFDRKIGWFASRKQKKALADLKAEATKIILEKKVTYNWWMNFHVHLSNVLTRGEMVLVEDMKLNALEEMIHYFPKHILIPTPLGSLGFMTFNRAFHEGVYPAGIISRKQAVAGVKRNSNSFFFHDINHAIAYIRATKGYDRHKKILDHIEDLPVEKRKRTELIYFIITHENSKFGNFMPQSSLKDPSRRESAVNQLVKYIEVALRDQTISREMIGLKRRYFKTLDDKQHIKGIADGFMEEFML